MLRRLVCLLLGGAALLAQEVQAQDAQDAQDAAVAPVHCWYTEGGCAARTGATRTALIRDVGGVAWTFTAKGTIEGEPLVWWELVVVCEVRDQNRLLHVLRLRDGLPYCQPLAIPTDRPLRPSIWGRHVAVRVGADRIRVYRFASPMLVPVYDCVAGHEVSSPLLFGDELYVCAGGAVQRHSLKDRKVVWSVGGKFASSVSLRKKSVFAVEYGAADGAFVVRLSRRTGKRRADAPAGDLHGRAALAKEHPLILVGRKIVLVKNLRTMTYRGRDRRNYAANTAQVVRPLNGNNGFQMLVQLSAPPAMHEGAWFGRRTLGEWCYVAPPRRLEVDPRLLKDPRVAEAVAAAAKRVQYHVLADKTHHADLVGIEAAGSVAAGIGILGGLAFDADDGRVVWKSKRRPTQRPVPARDALLMVEEGKRLVALVSAKELAAKAATPAGRVVTAKLDGPLKVSGARVVLRDGERRRTTISYDPQDKVFYRGGGRSRKEYPLEQVLLVTDRKHQPIFWRGTPKDIAQALTWVIDDRVTRAYVKLAHQAALTNDVPYMLRLQAEIEARGATARDLKAIRDRLALIKVRNLRVRPKYLQRAKEKERNIYRDSLTEAWEIFPPLVEKLPFEHNVAAGMEMLNRDPDLYGKVWELLKRFDTGLSDDQRLDLLERTLEVAPQKHPELWSWIQPRLEKLSRKQQGRVAGLFLAVEPKHEGATALVRKLSPIPVASKEHFSAAEWLELIEAARHFKVEMVKPLTGQPNPTPAQLELHRWRSKWRTDLYAVQSDRIVIITPVLSPGRIARVLSTGELLCNTLAKMFGEGRKHRARISALVILLYESQEEYVRQSVRRGTGLSIVWTAGHYDPRERKSYMFLPPGRGAFERVMSVFCHELTHHWIDVKCPQFDIVERARWNPGTKGFWIIEGFASLVESFEFDLGSRTCDLTGLRSADLDIVAHVKEKDLLPWKQVFLYSSYDMHSRLGSRRSKRIVVNTTWRLGQFRSLDAVGLFYAQAGAACHYLFHAENGKYRRQLLDYLGLHYRGKGKAELSIQKCFGISEDELGKRIVAHAKKILGKQ